MLVIELELLVEEQNRMAEGFIFDPNYEATWHWFSCMDTVSETLLEYLVVVSEIDPHDGVSMHKEEILLSLHDSDECGQVYCSNMIKRTYELKFVAVERKFCLGILAFTTDAEKIVSFLWLEPHFFVTT
jgi:hypothetical protein